jgi:hypothetical protein
MTLAVGFSIKVPSSLTLLNNLKYLALDALISLRKLTSQPSRFKIHYPITMHSYTLAEGDVILQTILISIKVPTMQLQL